MPGFPCPHCKGNIELLTQKEIVDQYGMSQSGISQRRQAGKFPEPTVHSSMAVLWTRDVVDEFFRDRNEDHAARLVAQLEAVLKRSDAIPTAERKRLATLLAGK